jgi:hypothetical protein
MSASVSRGGALFQRMSLFGQLEREFLALGLKRFLRQVEG